MYFQMKLPLLRLRGLLVPAQGYLGKRLALSELRGGVEEGTESSVSVAETSRLDGAAPGGWTAKVNGCNSGGERHGDDQPQNSRGNERSDASGD